MLCYIYRSRHKTDTFLYLAVKDNFAAVPEALLKIFGAPQFSFSFELNADRKLARENNTQVLQTLETQGYYLQMQSTDRDRDGNRYNRSRMA